MSPAASSSKVDRPKLTSAELAAEIARYALEKKAQEVLELDMRGLVGYTDFFVICTGNTDRQVKAIHDAILAGAKQEHGVAPRRVEGQTRAQWILMDYLDTVVHVFTPATREFYRLEQLWGEAPARLVEETQ
jgi:ribosome-associated protein